MHRSSQVLVTAIVTMTAVAATSVRTDESQTPQPAAAVQGWAGTAPSAEPPLEPKPPATVKEGEVWIPPLPTMESVTPPPRWVTSGPDVPPMPLTLLRLPRTNITRAKFPAIDFHVHAPQLTTAAVVPGPHHIDGLDRHGSDRQSERRHRTDARRGVEGGRAVPRPGGHLPDLQSRRHQ